MYIASLALPETGAMNHTRCILSHVYCANAGRERVHAMSMRRRILETQDTCLPAHAFKDGGGSQGMALPRSKKANPRSTNVICLLCSPPNSLPES